MVSYILFVVVNLILLLPNISMNAVSVAFPEITTFLDNSLVTAGWVLSIYILVSTAAVVLVGNVSNIFGRKSIFLVCIALFTPLKSLLSL